MAALLKTRTDGRRYVMPYPLRIFVKPYGGRKPDKIAEFRRRIEIAKAIEKQINEVMKDEPAGSPKTFFYHDIAEELALDEDMVYRILYRVDGGSNGITIGKPVASA